MEINAKPLTFVLGMLYCNIKPREAHIIAKAMGENRRYQMAYNQSIGRTRNINKILSYKRRGKGKRCYLSVGREKRYRPQIQLYRTVAELSKICKNKGRIRKGITYKERLKFGIGIFINIIQYRQLTHRYPRSSQIFAGLM